MGNIYYNLAFFSAVFGTILTIYFVYKGIMYDKKNKTN